MADLIYLGAITHLVSLDGPFGPDRAGIVAGQTVRVRSIHHREIQIRIEPNLGFADVALVCSESWCQRESMSLGHLAKPFNRRPWTLGIDMIGSHR